MNFTIDGRIIHASKQTGVSSSGNKWEKMNYVLETFEPEPSKIPFSVFGARNEDVKTRVGESVTLEFSIDGREYNGKWYVDINAESISKISAQTVPTIKTSKDDLPF